MKENLGELLMFGGLALIVVTLLCFCLIVYLAYFRLKEILTNLKSSSSVSGYDFPLGIAPLMRLALLGYIGMMLTLPQSCIKNGTLSAHDYARFPKRLKFLVKFCNCFVWSLLVVLLIVWGKLP